MVILRSQFDTLATAISGDNAELFYPVVPVPRSAGPGLEA
jgi:hypothetical protein